MKLKGMLVLGMLCLLVAGVSGAEWSPRLWHSTVAMSEGSIILTGGFNWSGAGVFYNDTWHSTNQGTTWALMNVSSGWGSRDLHSSVAMPDGSIVLMGGMLSTGLSVNDTWRSTDNGLTWVRLNASSGWPVRAGHSSVVMPDGSIVLMGGSPDGATFYNDTWRSTDYGAHWIRMNASSGWSKRFYHSSVAMPDGSIVIIGGFDGGSNLNDTWRSTNNGATWIRQTPSAEWEARRLFTAVSLSNGNIVLMGGSTAADMLNDTWRSTNNGATWTRMNASSGWAARYGLSSVVFPDDYIYIIGGGTSTGGGEITHSDVWRSIDLGATWTEPPFNPIVTSISPTHGPESGGTVVNITGSGLTGATSVYLSVKFGAIPGSGTVFISDTNISSISPPGTGTVHITVATPNGTSATSASDLFTYDAPPTPTPIQNTNTLWSPHQVVFQCLDGNNNPIINTPISALASYTTLPGGMANAISLVQSAYGMPADSASQLINTTTAMSGVTDRTGSAVFVMLPVIAYDITFKDATGINYTTAAPIMPQDAYYQLNTPNATSPSQATLELAYVAKMNASVFNTTYSQTANGTLGTLGMYIYDSTGQTTGANCWWTLMDNSTTWWSNRTWAPGSGLQTFGKTVITTPFQQWKWGCSTL